MKPVGERKKPKRIRISAIKINPKTFPRDKLDDERIAYFTDLLLNDPQFDTDPVWITQRRELISGHHRCTAYRNAGRETIPYITNRSVDVFKDAVVANNKTAFPYTKREIRRHIRRLSEKYPPEKVARFTASTIRYVERVLQDMEMRKRKTEQAKAALREACAGGEAPEPEPVTGPIAPVGQPVTETEKDPYVLKPDEPWTKEIPTRISVSDEVYTITYQLVSALKEALRVYQRRPEKAVVALRSMVAIKSLCEELTSWCERVYD